MVTSPSPGIAIFLVSEIVEMGYDPSFFPLETSKQAHDLVRDLPWDVFVGVWPRLQDAASASVAIAKQAELSLHSVKIVDFGGEALLIANRRKTFAAEAEGNRLIAALDRMVAVQDGLETHRHQAVTPSSKQDVVSRAELRGLAHRLNNLLTVMVGCGEVLLHRSADDAPTRKYAECLLTAVARAESITEYLSEDCRLSDESSVVDIRSSLAGFRCLTKALAGERLQAQMRLSPKQSG